MIRVTLFLIDRCSDWSFRKKLREAGRETVINVLDAENEVFNARINYTSAFFDTRQATYQLLLAVGRLSENTITQ